MRCPLPGVPCPAPLRPQGCGALAHCPVAAQAAESSAALQGLQQRTAEQEATIHQLERLARARLDERQQAAEQVPVASGGLC